MKHLTEYITESLFGSKDVKFAMHVLDMIRDMADNKEKEFGIKFDEIGGDLAGGVYHNSDTLADLEQNKHLTKMKDGKYCIKVTTTTHENTVPCEISVDADIVIGRDNKLSDDEIKKRIKDAVDELKTKTKLY